MSAIFWFKKVAFPIIIPTQKNNQINNVNFKKIDLHIYILNLFIKVSLN